MTNATEAFNKLDLNGDGVVDREEVRSLITKGAIYLPESATEQMKEEKIDEFFARYDENWDGKI